MRLSLYKWTFFLLLFFASSHQCAKVLFTVFHDRGSHFASMFPLMEKLARHGHAVSVLDTIHRSDRSSLIRHIRAPLPHAEVEDEAERHAFAEFFWNQTDSSVTLPEFYRQSDEQLATLMLNHSKKMVALINEDWDLLVIDDLMWPFGYFMATLKRRSWESARKGPRPHLIVYGTAAQTLISAESIRAITESYMMPNIAKFGVPNFSWAELFRQTEYEFSDFIDRMGWPLAHGPDMVNLGSHCRSAAVSLLHPAFSEFVDVPFSRGTVLFAFGSYPDWQLAPPRILNALFGTMNALSEYRIIFAYDGPPVETTLKFGDHIKMMPWVPQLEILAHAKTVAFITHGGLKSVREGFCAGVPMIVMPLFAEQAHQAHLLLAMGMASVINKYSLTEQSVLHTIQTVQL
ncbi:hypothetical protein niasHT_021598 [Heterodera trifolii]|uniref:UDP-glucuronosyltransferase n=1 Tax=Heterodera trifolii TaxID=157864 RepID=A0ABD2K5Z9_9BILA